MHLLRSCLHCRGAYQQLSVSNLQDILTSIDLDKTLKINRTVEGSRPGFNLFVEVHEENDLVFYGGEQVVFVDQLVNIFVPQSQVDL